MHTEVHNAMRDGCMVPMPHGRCDQSGAHRNCTCSMHVRLIDDRVGEGTPGKLLHEPNNSDDTDETLPAWVPYPP